MEMKVITFQRWKCLVDVAEYRFGGVALKLRDYNTSEPIATATVWVNGLDKTEIGIKDYSENEGMLDALMIGGIVKPPHRTVRSGLVIIPICKFTTEFIEQLAKGEKE